MIGPFVGRYHFLSNFYLVPVTLADEVYPSVEHAYQAAKSVDPLIRARIRTFASPARAKHYMRTQRLRPGWWDMNLVVMNELLRQKFTYAHLRRLLVETYPEDLVEINTWHDTFWGVYRGRGQNYLGKLLMEIREHARAEEPFS